jgi:hypothetical protein
LLSLPGEPERHLVGVILDHRRAGVLADVEGLVERETNCDGTLGEVERDRVLAGRQLLVRRDAVLAVLRQGRHKDHLRPVARLPEAGARRGNPCVPVLLGLSYTTFSLGNHRLAQNQIGTDGTVVATAELTNTGKVAGEEVVQLYIGARSSKVEPTGRPSQFPGIVQPVPQSRNLRRAMSSRAR